jgi:hypothetical protein
MTQPDQMRITKRFKTGGIRFTKVERRFLELMSDDSEVWEPELLES